MKLNVISVIVILQYYHGYAQFRKGTFICNEISDSLIKSGSHENQQERMKAMEEQILQLQRLVAIGFENVTSLHKDTLPTGMGFVQKCIRQLQNLATELGSVYIF